MIPGLERWLSGSELAALAEDPLPPVQEIQHSHTKQAHGTFKYAQKLIHTLNIKKIINWERTESRDLSLVASVYNPITQEGKTGKHQV